MSYTISVTPNEKGKTITVPPDKVGKPKLNRAQRRAMRRDPKMKAALEKAKAEYKRRMANGEKETDARREAIEQARRDGGK